jgi:tripartite ATP-independent transporter DctP family solute receptor
MSKASSFHALPLLLVLSIGVHGAGCRDRAIDPGAPRLIKLATILPESHGTVKAMLFFKERMQAISGGRIRVNLFASGQLGNPDELIDGCRTGDIEMAQNSVAILAEYLPIANALAMPFIFRDSDHQARALRGEIGTILRERCRPIGLELLGFLDAGTRNITTTTGPIRSPEDLRGMKIRVMDAQLMVDSINALGASAVAMNQGEVFTALQQGLLDGWENNPQTVVTFRMYETGCKYWAWTRHLAIPDIFIASRRFMNELSGQERAWVEAAVAETLARQWEMWKIETQRSLDDMIEHGMQINEVDRAPFEARVQPIYREYYARYGEEFRRVCELIRSMP